MTEQRASTADLRSRVLNAVLQEPVAARPQASRRRAWLVALGFAGTGVIALGRHLLERANAGATSTGQARPLWRVVSVPGTTLPHRPESFVVLLVCAWLLVVVAATWAGLARGRSMLGRSLATKLSVATLTPCALALTWLAVAHVQLHALDETPDSLLHMHCALMSVAYALCPLVAFLAVRRGSDPIAPRSGGAAIGAVAGAWGALLYVASCDCTSPIHIALAHLLPISLMAVVGALVGERVLGLETWA
jgi:hypothetical protein